MYAFLCLFRSLVIVWLLSALSVPACVDSAHVDHAVVEPGDGKGEVTVDLEDNGNGDHLVVVALEDLPPPSQHGPGYRTYVVWVRPLGMHVLKAGELAYDPELEIGALRMVTPYESFELLVTAERDPAVETPSSAVVDRRIVQRAR